MMKNKHELLLEKIIENSFGNIFVTDNAGRIIYTNENLRKSLDISEESLIEKTAKELWDDETYNPIGEEKKSMSEMAKKMKKPVYGSVLNRKNEELFICATPVYDCNDELEMVVAFSLEKNKLKTYIGEIEDEIKRVKEKTEKCKQTIRYLDKYLGSNIEIIAKSPAAIAIFTEALNIAYTDSSVLIQGESGTGKDVLARYIVNNSRRANNIFLPVNCAALPHNLIESELFGYDPGAFTGGDKLGKAGLFELADGGTLFLDEIGELPLDVQAKLLRTLESNEVRRIGSSEVKKPNVRLIFATNNNLEQKVKENKFREDLYYRINVIPLIMPPLRERKEDLHVLSTVMLCEFNEKYGKNVVLSENMLNQLNNYSWPGNIRELKNVMERIVITYPHREMAEESLEDSIKLFDWGNPVNKGLRTTLYEKELKDAVQEFESKYISEMLKQCNGKVVEAAKKLGVHRSVIYKKIKRSDLEACR